MWGIWHFNMELGWGGWLDPHEVLGIALLWVPAHQTWVLGNAVEWELQSGSKSWHTTHNKMLPQHTTKWIAECCTCPSLPTSVPSTQPATTLAPADLCELYCSSGWDPDVPTWIRTIKGGCVSTQAPCLSLMYTELKTLPALRKEWFKLSSSLLSASINTLVLVQLRKPSRWNTSEVPALLADCLQDTGHKIIVQET